MGMLGEFIYSEEFDDELRSDLEGFLQSYKDEQNDRHVFEFKSHDIELSSHYIESCDEDFLVQLLKVMSRPAKPDIEMSSEKEVVVQVPMMGDGAQSPLPESVIEANRYIQAAHMQARAIMDLSPSTAGEPVALSTIQAKYLKTMMDKLTQTKLIIPSPEVPVEVNKQGESVYVRPIEFEGREVGTLQYLESDDEVVILRSDVNEADQGKGLGTRAYRLLIEEKLSQGKRVGSDSIVSQSAQGVYKKLQSLGYDVRESASRVKHRMDKTSLTSAQLMSQRASHPIRHIDGVNVSESGYRMKGESVYTVKASPKMTIPEVTMVLVDKSKSSQREFFIRPNAIESKMFVSDQLKDFSKEGVEKVQMLLSDVKGLLSGTDWAHEGSAMNLSLVKIIERAKIERGELERALVVDCAPSLVR